MHLLRRLYFNLRYLRRPAWDTGISPPELIEQIQQMPVGHALDMGCGTGTNVIMLAEHGWKVTGVDFAWRAIRLAHQKAHLAGVSADFRVEDVTRLTSLDGPFELIVDIGCFHNLPSVGHSAYLFNVERLLAPGGIYLLYVFFRDENKDSGPGVVEADLQRVAERLKLKKRVNGTERGRRPAAWLTFSKV